MELPGELIGTVVSEGEKYFFTVDCPIGLQLIANGVKLSPEVERRIKDLF